MRRALIACLVVAACGDNTTITVGFPNGAVAFATYKADDGWHHPEQTPTGYRIDRAGPYQFVWVCSQNGAFDVEELFADTSEGDQSVAPVETSACYPDGGPVVSGAFGRISGTVVQAGTLEVGNFAAYSPTPNWTYNFEAPQGTHDLLFGSGIGPAFGVPLVVRHDVVIGDVPVVQPPIDLSAEEVYLVQSPLAVAGLATDEQVTTETTLVSHDDRILLASAGATPVVLPAAAVGSSAYQLVSVDTSHDASAEDEAYYDPAVTQSVAFIPPPDVTFTATATGIKATWAHASIDPVGFELSVSDGTSVIHGFVSPSLADDHVLDLSIDPEVQGFLDAWRPAWSHDLDAASATFKVTASRDHGCYGTFISQNGTAPVWGLRCPLS